MAGNTAIPPCRVTLYVGARSRARGDVPVHTKQLGDTQPGKGRCSSEFPGSAQVLRKAVKKQTKVLFTEHLQSAIHPGEANSRSQSPPYRPTGRFLGSLFFFFF